MLNARRPGGLGRQTTTLYGVSAPRRSCKPASGRSSRPDGALFRTSGPLVSGLQVFLLSSSTRRRKREEPNNKTGHSACLFLGSLGPSRSSASTECIHSTVSSPRFHFLEPSTAEPDTGPDRLGPRRKSPSCAGQVEDRRSAGVCVHGMMGWWSRDQTGRWVEVRDSNPSRNQQEVVSIATPLNPASDQIRFPQGINPDTAKYFDQPPSPSPSPSCYHFASLLAHPEPKTSHNISVWPNAMQHTHASGHPVKPLLHHSPNPSPLPLPSPNSGSFPKQGSVHKRPCRRGISSID